jgi:hypothetical protein
LADKAILFQRCSGHSGGQYRQSRYRLAGALPVAWTGGREAIAEDERRGGTMSISDQIDALQQRAADLKNSFEQSTKETNEQVKERLGHAKADIEARQDEAKTKAGQAADRAQGQWAAMKADAAARVQAIRDKVDRQRDELDVKRAERDAEDAEADAADALDYAAYVVDQAQLAVLDAVDARTWADARAAAQAARS